MRDRLDINPSFSYLRSSSSKESTLLLAPSSVLASFFLGVTLLGADLKKFQMDFVISTLSPVKLNLDGTMELVILVQPESAAGSKCWV